MIIHLILDQIAKNSINTATLIRQSFVRVKIGIIHMYVSLANTTICTFNNPKLSHLPICPLTDFFTLTGCLISDP